MSQRTVALLGDSVLDNAAYTHPEPDTPAHLARLLGPAWQVQHLAQDGATMQTVGNQLARLEGRPDVTVLSVGGNDALTHSGLLDARPGTDVLGELLAVAEEFARRYDAVARAVAQQSGRTMLCTIYEVPLEPPVYARRAHIPLAVLNDAIIRTAGRYGLDVLELRSVCVEARDFVLQIEPSAAGATKIARAIAAVLGDQTTMRVGRVHAVAGR